LILYTLELEFYMRIKLLMTFFIFCVSSVASANCSVYQRADLAKAGYAKGEIEGMCKNENNESAQDASANETMNLQGIELLSKASIAGSNKEDREGRRCEVQEEGLVVKGELISFDKLIAFTQKNI